MTAKNKMLFLGVGLGFAAAMVYYRSSTSGRD